MRARKWLAMGVAGFLCLLVIVAGGRHLYLKHEQTAPMTSVEANWGITLPRPMTALESHSEPSFHGDGYRIKVFSATSETVTAGTFLDPASMSSESLTTQERDLVTEANAQFKPEHPLDPDHRSLRKAHALRPNGWTTSEFILAVHDSDTGLFYVYESFI